jgi:thiamine-monophosphate kinase
VAAGLRLAGLASSCIDVSDGLFADLGHLCERSGVGAEIGIDTLPASRALRHFAPTLRRDWQASGGDDYELCFTAASARRPQIESAMREAQTPVTRIGHIVAGDGVRAFDANDGEWRPARGGYVHFA